MLDLSKADTSWENWKKYLGQAMEFAEELGISKAKIETYAMTAGTILAENVPPANPEQKAVKELWEVADKDEQQVLARLMTKLASRSR
ncbi:hypothetical protein Desca_2538 [Desulfotomaculum nigrificans CO-1-SRB]|uniref:DUF3243 domain-containing protein n=1 Tax=Desulfotomaculum nigrificans (strain DSM 14880 / VKM B-2319 / CO-1-SRB) TaxID=868595 RepID=F6B4Z0_DESCC|nr:DUF3243 domain-containing protein [Desulfotomaculum nigrificans]AEF95362.1 hypothetical protein Desca_2538 [Desulfotomaculum nigrificans CO-1-SRB]